MPYLSSKAFFATSLACGILGLAVDAEAACPGTQTAFAHRVPVNVTNGGAAALTNSLAVVSIDHAALVAATKARADGGDLRFSDDQCNPLDFWVDHGLDTAAARIWVKVPNLAVGANTLYAFYGAPAETRVNDPALLFGAGLLALYPMTEGTGTVVHDRVGGFDLDMTGTVAWQAGPRQGTFAVSGFGSGTATRTATKPVVGADFSVFAAINPTDVSGTTQGIIGNYQGDSVPGWTLKLQGGSSQYMFITNAGGWCQDPASSGAAANTWQSLGAKREAGLKTAYLNGAANGTSCAGDTRDVSTNNTGPWQLGRSYGSQYPLSGAIAFTALYGVTKTDAEMAALHAGLAFGSSLTLALGAEIGRAGAPTITNADGQDEQAVFTFTPPTSNGGSAITSYTVSCNGGEKTVSGATSPLTLTGLTNGTTYTCVVRATNELGDGADSTSIQVGPADVPDAPTNLAAAVTGTSSSLSFTPPTNDGGSPVTGYVLKCQAGAISKDGTASPIVLTALTPGAYTCFVAAKNVKGTGPESEAATFTIAAPVPEAGTDSGSNGGSDAGTPKPTVDAGVPPNSGTGPSDAPSIDDAGCSCHVPAQNGTGAPLAAVTAAFAFLGAAIRRRHTRKR
jgi:hypothetical protein